MRASDLLRRADRVPQSIARPRAGHLHVTGVSRQVQRESHSRPLVPGDPATSGQAVSPASAAVERGARAHRRGGLLGVRVVVAADVHRRALHGVELADDRRPPPRQAPRPARRSALASSASSVWRGQLLRPVQREVEVAAAVVELADACARATGSPPGSSPVARSSVSPRIFARGLPVLSASISSDTASARNSPRESQRRWFSLTNCWTCFGADPPAPVSNSPPPSISGTIESIFALVPELEDREQVGQVVAQHVAGDRDGVLAVAGPLQREPGGLGDVHDLDLQAVGVELLQRRADLLEQLGVVRARLVQPEHRRASRWRGHAPRRARPSSGSGRAWSGTCARCRRPRRRARAASCRSRRRPGRCPAPVISKVLSCEPYSSAFCAISPTFGVVPMVAGSKAPCSGSARRSRRRAAA